ncbi:retrotransposon ORF1 [Tanacetum coccineum]
MDGRGTGSCIMIGYAPSCPSFLVSSSVKLSVAGRGGAEKGGSCVLISDLVVIAKVGALGLGVLLLLIVKSIREYCSCSSLRYHLGIRHILQFESTFFFGERVEVELSELVEFPTVVLGYIQALLMGSSSPCLNRRIKSQRAEVLRGVGGLGPVLLDEDASSSKRFLPAIASNWLKRLLAGSISIWEDVTTHFLAQFFPPGRTTKLRNDILMFQQHQGESLSEAWTRFKDLLQKVPHYGIDLWLQNLALYDNESWNDPRDFGKPVKAISLPQDVPSTRSLAPMQPIQVNKITSSCEICSGPHDTQYCMENPEQAFVEYASSRTDEAGGLVSNFMASQDARLSKFEADFKQQQSEMTNKIDTDDDLHIEEPEVGENAGVRESKVEYFDIFPTRSEFAYHKYLMCGPIPSIFLRNPNITEGCPSNLKVPCNIGHVHVEKVYIDLNSPLNVMTLMLYNWTMRRKLDLRENTNGGVNNFTRRIKGMHIFVGNFTYIIDFMIIEDISSIIDPRLSQVVLGRPFVEISNMTHDLPEGVIMFTNGTDEIAYKRPHKIEQNNSLLDLERDHTKLVYLRNEEDKRSGVEYVMSKILRFYKECLELGPEYLTGIADEGEVTKFFKENEKKIFSDAEDDVRIYPDDVVIFDEKKLGSS